MAGTQFTYKNWANTFSCTPERCFEPETEAEVVDIVRSARTHHKVVKVFGAGHSPSDLPCSRGYMLNLDKLSRVLQVNTAQCTVTVEAGIRLFQLHPILRKYGLAISVLGAISDQSVAGAIATATHGTGVTFGNMSTMVTKLRLVDGTGAIVECSADNKPHILAAAQCHIGALGIITQVTLQCEPAFRLESVQYPIPFDTMVHDLPQLIKSAEHTKFIWFPYHNNVVISKLNRTTKPASRSPEPWIWTKQKDRLIYELELYASRFMPSLLPGIEQRFWNRGFNRTIRAVDWSENIFNFDCMFPQYTTEWAIPQECASQAIQALNKVLAQARYPIHFPIEIRFAKQDDVWLSPSYHQDVCYIGIVIYKPLKSEVAYHALWQDFEKVMRSFRGRPHWAKFHTMGYEDLVKLYPKLPDFLKVREELDPDGIFINDYVRRHLFPGNTPTLPEQRDMSYQFASRPLKSKL
ncbi:D-arabinono-1,4-lactone oxidase [Dimargaris xerosporica]|nr:D-arabinono-1,4-lactone oxidase [Dimargaris xerosporica]